MNQATESTPAATASLFASAVQHHQQGEFAQAERIYREILSIHPLHPDCLHLLGMLGFQCGHRDDALRLIRQAIACRPDIALYHSNLGIVLNSFGKFDQAIQSYQRAITLKPNYADAFVNLGITLTAQAKYSEAIATFQKVLATNPNHADSHVNLGVCFAEQGKLPDAISHYRQAIALNPKSAEALSNLGNAYQAQHNLEDALHCYRSALELKPDYLLALYNYGNAKQAQNNFKEAIEIYDRALTLSPTNPEAKYGKALAQLVQADFANGWPNYEVRWQTAGHRPLRAYLQPRWNGERLPGNLLLWPEQGVGDEIMFAGLIPDVLRATKTCILDCDARLKPLFARSFPDTRVVSGFTPTKYPKLKFVAHQPLGSLPGLFRKTLDAFAATTSPYLIPDEKQRRRLRARYQCGKRLIGLAWHTKNLKSGYSRSIALSLLKPLFQQENISCISLQYGDHHDLEKQAVLASAPVMIDREVDQLTNMDAFAAQVAAMDLVITIDNSTAHLAGALGVPVWVLLPYARDWRWLQDRETSPWYPSMRLFRQSSTGDWPSVIEQVAQALRR